MNVRALLWAVDRLRDGPSLTSQARLVLTCLAAEYDEATHVTSPTVATMAAFGSLSPRSVHRGLNELLACGLIVKANCGVHGGRSSTRYRLALGDSAVGERGISTPSANPVAQAVSAEPTLPVRQDVLAGRSVGSAVGAEAEGPTMLLRVRAEDVDSSAGMGFEQRGTPGQEGRLAVPVRAVEDLDEMDENPGPLENFKKIFADPVFRNKTEASVFLWLVVHALPRAGTVATASGCVILEAGEVCFTDATIARGFNLTPSQVRTLRERLAGASRIVLRLNGWSGQIASIVNYQDYLA